MVEAVVVTHSCLTGYYFTGDGALRDEDNDYRITGRVDDMLNSKGHRLGTAELECAMVSVYCGVIIKYLNLCKFLGVGG